MFLDCSHTFSQNFLQAGTECSELRVDKFAVDELYNTHDDLLKSWDVFARLPLALEFCDVVKEARSPFDEFLVCLLLLITGTSERA